jgi:hypothetical protein
MKFVPAWRFSFFAFPPLLPAVLLARSHAAFAEGPKKSGADAPLPNQKAVIRE